ncbi:NAD(P)-dependent oxidoreductase [Citricoccus sp. GCM10030269]|uniref:NAD(P)-dependent oxidoreductase n=1 Tax=Citricoccus sp. GCM10030269 TaxID=3273388 RepID=UPI00360618A8
MHDVVGFIGLGTMGHPMVTNIARHGYDPVVYDAAPGRAAEVAAEINGHAAETLDGLAECTVVVTMLPTSAIVRSVLLHPDGALAIPLRAGSVVIDMSSSDPRETVETGALLSEHGVTLVDAPVSGARERAVQGTLSIMLGADDDEAASRAMPVLETMSRQVYRTGKLGTGDAMKALNNFVAGAAFVASCEALLAGERFGLDRQLMVDILNDSTGQTFSSSHVLGPHVVEGQFASGFALPLLTKDVLIAQGLEASTGVDAIVCEATASALSQALESLGNVDHSQAYTYWEAKGS